MKKTLILLTVIAVSFSAGFFLKTIITNKPDNSIKLNQPDKKMTTKKVTGIGGIFFKCQNSEKITNWYRDNLGLTTNEYGSMFEFRNADNPEQIGYLQWSPFSDKSDYFEPSTKDFMINYRVENIEKLVQELKENGVEILDTIQKYEYGKFVHLMDPEGNKIELWEPVDDVLTK